MTLEEIISEIVRLPVAEQVGLSNVLADRLHAAAGTTNRNRKTTAAEVDDALASTAGV